MDFSRKNVCKKGGELSNALLTLLLQNTECPGYTDHKDFVQETFDEKGGKLSNALLALFVSEF